MHTDTTTAGAALNQFTDRAANKADDAINNSKRVAQDALNSVQDGVDQLREAIPSAFTRAAAQVEALTRQGLDRARQASADVRGQVTLATDKSAQYIKEEPLKSVLLAAAAGAALAGLVSLLTRPRAPRV